MMLGGDGYSMLSRAGKFTEEIHMILKNQQEILNGQPKKRVLLKSSSANRIVDQSENEREMRIMNQINMQMQEAASQKQKDSKLMKSASLKVIPRCKTAMFSAVSREEYYSVRKIKYPIPPCGSYKVNYQSVDRAHKPLNWTQSKTESKVVKEKVEPPMRLIEMAKDTIGFLDFKRQNAKLNMVQMSPTPINEKRFIQINHIPNISSKSRKNYTISFKQTLPRDDKLTAINLTPSTYKVNFEYNMPKLSKALVPFSKVPMRKPIDNVNRAVTGESTDYDNIEKYYQRHSKYKKILTPDLNKQYQRGDSSPTSKLPLFMSGVFDRISINELSAKMLETNNFSDGQFQSIVSSFEPKNNFRSSQETFGSPTGKSKGQNQRMKILGEYAKSSMKSRIDEGTPSMNQLLTRNQMFKPNNSSAIL